MEELRKPRLLKIKKSIQEEYPIIKEKIQDLAHVLDTYPEHKHITRVRHYRARVLRMNTVTREQQRLKDELILDIERLLERHGAPENRERSGTQTKRTMDDRTLGSKTFHQGTDQHNDRQQLGASVDRTLLVPNRLHLFDEATGGEVPPEIRNNIQDAASSTILPNQYRNREGDILDFGLHTPLLPSRNQSTGAIPRPDTNQKRIQRNDGLKAEVNRYIQETLTVQMSVMMDQFKQISMQHMQQLQDAAVAFRHSEASLPRRQQPPRPPQSTPRARPSTPPQVDFDFGDVSPSEDSFGENRFNRT